MTAPHWDNAADAHEFASMIKSILSGNNDLWDAVYGTSYRPRGIPEEDADYYHHRVKRMLGIAAGFFLATAERLAPHEKTSVEEILDAAEHRVASHPPPEPH
ncbi:hypothetical protein AB0F72_39235 [Actinoplanes sp. NPDC023936]|uniref:hypothetical protein n=1 Tax=Actinoplanes sp. NPDC023936 TaxID=3154910 RepID=UPI00340037AA